MKGQERDRLRLRTLSDLHRGTEVIDYRIIEIIGDI